MTPPNIRQTVGELLGKLHRHGATLTTDGGKLSILSPPGVTLANELRREIFATRTLAALLLIDWPTLDGPGPCPLCGSPFFRRGDAGVLLCCGCQRPSDADDTPWLQSIGGFQGDPVAWEEWEP